MPTIHNFTEAGKALAPFYDTSRTPYTLDAIRALLAHLGDPQQRLRVLHVAGTSGKTSTAYYAAALLAASGKTVGLSVSPHVDTVNERLQINGAPLPETEFCAVLGEFLDLVADAPVTPSYFELLVAMAYWQFAEQGLDYAVMEVGLGGLLDGTNVVDRADKVCLITDIGLDHTEILGDTLGKIAAQKAGIIQDNNAVFMYRQGSEVMESVALAVQAHGAHLHELTDRDLIERPDLPLFQQRNLGLAVRAVDYALERDYDESLSSETIDRAAHTTVPARLERFVLGGKLVIIDGSHNQQKLHAMLGSLRQLYPDQSVAALCGFVRGNDERWQGALDELLPAVTQTIFTTFHSQQDLPKHSVVTEPLVQYAATKGYTNVRVEDNPAAAYELLMQCPEPILLVTGSFYLLNHIRPLIRRAQESA